jgi:hypothetical protein
VSEDVTVTGPRRQREGAPRRRRWVPVAVFTWLVIGVLVGELREPPFDLVRVLFRTVLAGLMTWFLVSVLAHPSGPRD